jgi:hypothetical protein
VIAALRSITWRAVLFTQGLAALFALAPWLEGWGASWQPSLGFSLLSQSVAALLVMVATFVADEQVRGGMPVLRAFATQLLAACTATGVIVLAIDGHANFLTTFFSTGAHWSTPMLVYLNRQTAARLLATVQDGELRRVQEQRRLVESDLAAAQAEINPSAVLQQLGSLRDRYAAADPHADHELARLIADLRDTVARCNR